MITIYLQSNLYDRTLIGRSAVYNTHKTVKTCKNQWLRLWNILFLPNKTNIAKIIWMWMCKKNTNAPVAPQRRLDLQLHRQAHQQIGPWRGGPGAQTTSSEQTKRMLLEAQQNVDQHHHPKAIADLHRFLILFIY